MEWEGLLGMTGYVNLRESIQIDREGEGGREGGREGVWRREQ